MVKSEQQIKYLTGDNIYLRAIELNDLNSYISPWSNDSKVTHYMFTGVFPVTEFELKNEFERVQESKSDIWLMIVTNDNKPIGHLGLYSINWISRSAEFRIIIGEQQEQSRGNGFEASSLIINYAFDRLNLNKVWLGVNAENESALKLYKKLGFQTEGTLRDEIYRNSKYYDAIRMSILRNEYNAR